MKYHSQKIIFEKYFYIGKLSKDEKGSIGSQIHSILVDSWGRFHQEFINDHILGHNNMAVMAKIGNDYVGFCALSIKKICGKDVYYIEFLAVKRRFQNMKIGKRLFYFTIVEILKKNLLTIFYKPVEIMFITPNIRVLINMAKFSSFIYPNPYLSDKEGNIPPADNLTWKMAQELIESSDKPNRKLDRNGLVLHDSYASTPWLIYGQDNAPWVDNPKVTKFIKKYMGYQRGEDKELVVRTHFNLISIIKFLTI